MSTHPGEQSGGDNMDDEELFGGHNMDDEELFGYGDD